MRPRAAAPSIGLPRTGPARRPEAYSIPTAPGVPGMRERPEQGVRAPGASSSHPHDRLRSHRPLRRLHRSPFHQRQATGSGALYRRLPHVGTRRSQGRNTAGSGVFQPTTSPPHDMHRAQVPKFHRTPHPPFRRPAGCPNPSGRPPQEGAPVTHFYARHKRTTLAIATAVAAGSLLATGMTTGAAARTAALPAGTPAPLAGSPLQLSASARTALIRQADAATAETAQEIGLGAQEKLL